MATTMRSGHTTRGFATVSVLSYGGVPYIGTYQLADAACFLYASAVANGTGSTLSALYLAVPVPLYRIHYHHRCSGAMRLERRKLHPFLPYYQCLL
jgi:hypothetical protein